MDAAGNPGTRWLDPDEQATWRSLLQATRLLMARWDRELVAATGIPLTHYGVLVVLSEAPETGMRMSDIADALQTTPSSLSHAVARMEASGWVERAHCPSDRRGWFAVLTSAGREALDKAAPVHIDSVRRHLFDLLTPAQAAELRRINETVLGHLATPE